MIEVTRDTFYRTPEGKFLMVRKGYIDDEAAEFLKGCERYLSEEEFKQLTQQQ